MRGILKKSNSRLRRARGGGGLRFAFSLALAASLLLGGCFRSEQGEQFYGKVSVPSSQEFRWSDGGLPRVFDPARAATPPDTDAVRALFEGLTDYEPGTLRPVPAVATRWEPSDGGRTWTFHLRADARWSNGDPVTAQDFVRSWRRTLQLGERAPHAGLLANIEGVPNAAASVTNSPGASNSQKNDVASNSQKSDIVPNPQKNDIVPNPQRSDAASNSQRGEAAAQTPAQAAFGVVALDAHTLRVTLQRPDMNFPALVAHPVFRPVHELSPGVDLPELQEEQRQDGGGRGDVGIITNGAFSLARLAADGVELERAPGYWDASSVKLERVRFVEERDTEAALAAYREGEVDAVTNAAIEPLAVKLLTPYKDFRRETFAALNYYSFNTSRAPFDDRRVREALARSLDTERLSTDTLGGATEPARGFLPTSSEKGDQTEAVVSGSSAEAVLRGGAAEAAARNGAAALVSRTSGAAGAGDGEAESGRSAVGLEHNVARARALLAEAGFPGGAGFPRIRLLVNRNEQQRLVALAVARMWHDALGVETEVVVRGWEDYVAALRAGDYDVARRSLVMQTTDEETNMLQLFGDEAPAEETTQAANAAPQSSPAASPTEGGNASAAAQPARRDPPILTEADALRELPAIPIHFASSYALVKPYVGGFETNLLDAPSLKGVSINTDWRPPTEAEAERLALRGQR